MMHSGVCSGVGRRDGGFSCECMAVLRTAGHELGKLTSSCEHENNDQTQLGDTALGADELHLVLSSGYPDY